MNRLQACLLLCLFSLSVWAKPVIIFDAGSSGTRIYVYAVEGESAQSLHSFKVKPGLSSLDPNDTQAMDNYFNSLVQSAEAVLSPQEKSQTPFILYATAGMRMLPIEEQNALINAARLSLAKQADQYGYPQPLDEDVRVISGTEEGGFIWITDNYLNGNLAKDTLSTGNTVAALEMGGASSEIAFLSRQAKNFTLPYTQKGQTYPIYSVAYDGMGANEALAKVAASGHPQFAACFPVGAPYPLTAPVFTGTGDLALCTQTIKSIFLDRSALEACRQETPGQCSGLGVHQPSNARVNEYILTSAFYYLFDLLEIANKTVSYSSFSEEASGFCSLTWEEAKASYPKQDVNNLINYCFNAGLSQTLLDAWRIDSSDNLRAVSSLGGTPVEWPLGAALTK